MSLIILIILLLFITFLFNIDAKKTQSEKVNCYGFIIPLPQGNDSTLETFYNSRVRHMINDFLRENISVYWVKEDNTFLSKTINDEKTDEILFKKGAFIVPLTEDKYVNNLIFNIILNYNVSMQIDPLDMKIEIYYLVESIEIDCLKLNEPRIAQHLDKPIRYGWPSYLQVIDSGGFLNFECMIDNESTLFLNNEDFNVFIWPYLPDIATYPEQIQTFSNIDEMNAIREFVNNGGGYIGTCYGAYAASTGFIYSPFLPKSLKYVYNNELLPEKPIYSLAISDALMWVNPNILLNRYIVEIKIENQTHPLFYGVNEPFRDILKSPLYCWVGKNSEIIGSFSNIKLADNTTEVKKYIKNSIIGSPAWIYSRFGTGKLILFGTHPDFINNIIPLFRDKEWEGDRFYGRRVIHNALFFVTADDNYILESNSYCNISDLENTLIKFNSILLEKNKINDFDETIKNCKIVLNKIDDLNVTSHELQILFKPYENNSLIFEYGERILRYLIWYCEIFENYIIRANNTLEKIEQVAFMINEKNQNISNNLNQLKSELSYRLGESIKIIDKSINITENLSKIFRDPDLSINQKILLLQNRRELLTTFEINLKYVPQTYFESLKLLRHLWYNYQSSVDIE